LIEKKYLAIVEGNAEVGSLLIQDPLVEELFMTGGAATFDRIVWGSPDQQEQNKKSGKKVMAKKFETELGAVSPVIVIPGDWTSSQIDHHAQQLASMKILNGGHICASPQIVLTSKDWKHNKEFFDRVIHHISNSSTICYYPGTKEKVEKFKQLYPGAVEIKSKKPLGIQSEVNIVFIENVDQNSFALQTEIFGPVLTSLQISSTNEKEFFQSAIQFCNEKLFGTLSATVIVSPESEKAIGNFEEQLTSLKYGSIGINSWALNSYMYPPLTWGAFPGHIAEDIQSGIGQINNLLMFDKVERSVFRSPFISPLHSHIPILLDSKIYKRMSWLLLRPSYFRLISLLSGVMIGL